MINNSAYQLLTFSGERMDALNSIKYTLLLDYQLPEETPDSKLIDAISQSCKKCCRGLFSSEGGIIEFYFFGQPSKQKLTKKSESHVIKELEYFPNEGMQGFPSLITDHCIVSSYHSVLTALLNSKNPGITPYSIENTYSKVGVYYLYKNKRLPFQQNYRHNYSLSISATNAERSNRANSFLQSVQSHCRVLPNIENLFILPSSDNRYYRQFAPLFSEICKVSAFSWKHLFSSVKDTNKITVLETMQSISDNLYALAGLIYKSPVDELYYRYILERVFNFELTFDLLENIYIAGKDSRFSFFHNEILEVLCCCRNLPNAFSRRYFLNYAFEKVSSRPFSYDDFWRRNALKDSNLVFESAREFSLGFQFDHWIQQFRLFCNYMSYYVIPIYEWCFLNMLLEYLEKQNPHDDPISVLDKSLTLLADYISENQQRIENPFPGSSDSCGKTDLINHTYQNDWELPNGALQELIKNMCNSDEEQELNIRKINPDFFRGKRIGSIDDNPTRIRKFYLDLIRYSRLK